MPTRTLAFKSRLNDGFTLIELSIVLVIIGLIIGGIVIGRELIESAEIRATVAQIEKYDTAVFTFNNKYNALPGDIPPTQAVQLGFFTVTGPQAGEPLCGNGDERLVPGAYSGTRGEQLLFWRHLSEAGFIDGDYARAISTNCGEPLITITASTVGQYLPLAKVGGGNYIFVTGRLESLYDNVYVIYGVSEVDPTFYLHKNSAGKLTPSEAFGIDQKIDDGKPMYGRIFGAFDYGYYGLSPQGPSYVPNCVSVEWFPPLSNIDPSSAYMLTYNAPACSLVIEAPW